VNNQTIRITALCLANLLLATQGYAAEPTPPADGWATWQVDAVEGAPDLCCWNNWDARDVARKACRLDDDRGNLGSRDDATTDSVRVYARMAGGQVERLRAFSATCPVEAATSIRDLGNVPADDSARWLIKRGPHIDPDSGDYLLSALAMHRGDVAQNELKSIALGDGAAESRKKAVFWLAHVRGTAGADVATSVMFNDRDPELRQHAAFAITQSKSTSVTSDLIRLGNNDKDGEVRAQAWFWLAHTGAPDSEKAIAAALRKDSDERVREQAIFALSRLPDERATRALIGAAEDRSLSSEQRKRAVFWLAQSESKDAQTYLEKVLTRNLTD
jgi:HEAT repeat protein